jgi:hypothetical protein
MRKRRSEPNHGTDRRRSGPWRAPSAGRAAPWRAPSAGRTADATGNPLRPEVATVINFAESHREDLLFSRMLRYWEEGRATGAAR